MLQWFGGIFSIEKSGKNDAIWCAFHFHFLNKNNDYRTTLAMG